MSGYLQYWKELLRTPERYEEEQRPSFSMFDKIFYTSLAVMILLFLAIIADGLLYAGDFGPSRHLWQLFQPAATTPAVDQTGSVDSGGTETAGPDNPASSDNNGTSTDKQKTTKKSGQHANKPKKDKKGKNATTKAHNDKHNTPSDKTAKPAESGQSHSNVTSVQPANQVKKATDNSGNQANPGKNAASKASPNAKHETTTGHTEQPGDSNQSHENNVTSGKSGQ